MDATLKQLLEALVNAEFENQRLRQELEGAIKSRQELERKLAETGPSTGPGHAAELEKTRKATTAE
jgi:hypothetical protein